MEFEKFIRLPELRIVFFSFVLNFVWETFQSGFFEFQYKFGNFVVCMIYCASVDVFITIGLFAGVALVYKEKRWFLHPTKAHVAILLALSVVFNVFVEYFNVYVTKDWAYSQSMPVFFGIGLLPGLQWIVIPLLLLLTCRKQRRTIVAKKIGTLVLEETDIPLYYRSGFDSWLAKFYDLSFSLAFFGHGRKLHKTFIKFIPKNPKSILDLATGTGDVALEIKKAFSYAQVYGIDLAGQILDVAKRKALRKKLDVHWLKRNIEKTGCKSNTFDAVTISFGVHEVPPNHRFNIFKEAYRVLRSEGRFVIMDFHSPKNIVLKGLFTLFLAIFEESYAKTLLKEDLVRNLKNVGFHNVNKHYYCNELVQVVMGEK